MPPNRLAAPSIRFRIEPADVPPEKAARRLHLTLPEFQDRLPQLLVRGFPPPDPTTGNFDLEAIDRWRRLRHPRLFPELTQPPAVDDVEERRQGMVERFRAAEKRSRHG